MSDRSKSDIYRDTLPLLNSARVELLDHPKLVAQLQTLERRTARGGRDSIDHAPGGHDDVANAAAGALLNVARANPAPLQIVTLAGFGPRHEASIDIEEWKVLEAQRLEAARKIREKSENKEKTT